MIYFGVFIGIALCFAAFMFLVAFYMDWQERRDEVFFRWRNARDDQYRHEITYMNRPDLDFDLKELDKQNPKTLGTDIRRPKFGD